MKTFKSSLLLVLVSVAACGSGGASSDATSPATSATPTSPPAPGVTLPEFSDDLLLVVGDEGGFVPVEYLARRLPRYHLMADGRLFSQGPVNASFPGPALPNVQLTRLDGGEVAGLIRIVEDMGLDKMVDEVNRDAADRVADATDTTVTFYDEEGAHRFSVYALGLVTGSDQRVSQLEKLITQLDGMVAGNSSATWVPDRFRVLVLDAAPGFDPQFRNVQPWPLDRDPRSGEPGFLGWPCSVIDGSDAEAVNDSAASANEATVWDFEGTELGLVVRPLLPGEPGCES